MEQHYYIQITSTGAIFSLSGCPVTGGDIAQNIKVSKEIHDMIKPDKNKYMYNLSAGEWVKNPNYEAKRAQEQKWTRIDEIKAELEEIDKQSQRSARAVALCAINNEPPNLDDVEKLTELENQAGALRKELQEITDGLIEAAPQDVQDFLNGKTEELPENTEFISEDEIPF